MRSSFSRFLGSHMLVCPRSELGLKCWGVARWAFWLLSFRIHPVPRRLSVLVSLCSRPQRLSLFLSPLLWGALPTHSAPRVVALKPGSG